MSLGPLVEQAIMSQVVAFAIAALVVGVVIGAIAMALMRRRRSDR